MKGCNSRLRYLAAILIFTITIPVKALAGIIGSEAFISEFHYDNIGADENEFVELVLPYSWRDTQWSLTIYNGSNQSALTKIDAQHSGWQSLWVADSYGILWINTGLQNSVEGLALADETGTVAEFISYEGAFTAADGVAAGLSSLNIGVNQTSSTAKGLSLQLLNSSPSALSSPFTWQLATATPGQLNQTTALIQVNESDPRALMSMALALLFFSRLFNQNS